MSGRTHSRVVGVPVLAAVSLLVVLAGCQSNDSDAGGPEVKLATPASPTMPATTSESAAPRDECPWFVRHDTDPTIAASPLARAVIGGNVRQVERLLDAGEDPNQIDDRQWSTPLTLAAQGGCRRIVRILLRAGASPTVAHEEGRVALTYAVIAGDRTMVEELIAAGADASQSTRIVPTESPLHWAIAKPQPQLLGMLIDAASNVDVGTEVRDPFVDRAGHANPLESAVLLGRSNMALALVRSGATATEYALYAALDDRRSEVANALVDAGAADRQKARFKEFAERRNLVPVADKIARRMQ